MKAVTLHTHGGPEVLKYEELPDPIARAGQVRIAVEAIGVNHVDIWTRRGMPHLKLTYPHLLGADVAGRVDAIGDGVVGLKVGDPVVINPGQSCMRCVQCLSGRDNLCRSYKLMGEDISGGYGSLLVVPAVNVVPRPANISAIEAAALPVNFLTAWQMLTRKGEVKPGQDVVVIAAGSGVGTAAVQIAKLHGARVIATASTPEKLAHAKALGADEVINHATQDVVAEVKRLTDKRGADIVIEHVGKAMIEKAIAVAAWGGRVVTCGATSGFDASIDLRQIFFRQVALLGSTMAPKGDLFPILQHVAAKRLQPVIDRQMKLADAAAAHLLLEDRKIFGKIILIP